MTLKAKILALRDSHKGAAEVARELGCSRSYVTLLWKHPAPKDRRAREQDAFGGLTPQIIEMHAAGRTPRQIASELAASYGHVHRVVSKIKRGEPLRRPGTPPLLDAEALLALRDAIQEVGKGRATQAFVMGWVAGRMDHFIAPGHAWQLARRALAADDPEE